MNNRFIQIIIHFLTWALFFAILYTLVPRPVNMHPLLFLVIPNVLFVAYFYFNFYILIPDFFIPKKYITYALVNIICLLLTLFITSLVSNLRTYQPPAPEPPPEAFQQFGYQVNMPPFRFLLISPTYSYSIFAFAFVFLLSLVIRLTMQWQKSEQEKVNAQLTFLKMQINPHFMFNTLNNIYSMAVNKSEKTAEAIEMYTTMIRYVITETRNEFVSLDKKLEYLNDFIALQKMRLPENVKVNFVITGNPEGKRIAPMILMPFIENAFKYGISTEHESLIDIKIDITRNELHMLVSNPKFPVQLSKNHSSHLGIENTKKRLELIYPGKYLLDIHENDIEFNVSLHLVLK